MEKAILEEIKKLGEKLESLETNIADLRQEMRVEIQGLMQEMREEFTKVHKRFDVLEEGDTEIIVRKVSQKRA